MSDMATWPRRRARTSIKDWREGNGNHFVDGGGYTGSHGLGQSADRGGRLLGEIDAGFDAVACLAAVEPVFAAEGA
jgi:hypothetical protein